MRPVPTVLLRLAFSLQLSAGKRGQMSILAAESKRVASVLNAGEPEEERVHTLSHLSGGVSARGALVLLDVQRTASCSDPNQYVNSFHRFVHSNPPSVASLTPLLDSPRRQPFSPSPVAIPSIPSGVVSDQESPQGVVARQGFMECRVSEDREKTNRIVGRECASCCDAYQSWRYPSLHTGTTVSLLSTRQSLDISPSSSPRYFFFSLAQHLSTKCESGRSMGISRRRSGTGNVLILAVGGA